MDSKKILTLGIIIFVSFALIFIQLNSFREGKTNTVEKTVASAIRPFQIFFSGAGRWISGTWRSITKVTQLERKVKAIQAELDALKVEREIYNRTREENKRLRKLLNLSRVEQGKVIAAEVIARDPDNWFQTIKVNKGYKHGVSKNMAAITPEGIVGRVVDASPYTARIRLIFNEKSAVPAQIVSSGELGVVYGEGKNTCVMKYVAAEAEVKRGDQVITSRLSRIYPPGKIIGKVTRVYGRDQVLYQAVQVKPAVEFGNLEYMLLVGKK